MATRKTQKTKRMLIDASHPEETRVVVIDEKGRIEEFDYESAQRKQLKGNIYLARVTRVEPSLQAAFVDYGGNRHGFLAFSEIHPDYYQIPVADREALLKDEAQAESTSAAEDETADAEAEAERAVSEADENVETEENGEDEVSSVGAEDAMDELPLRSKAALRRRYKIQEVIRRGQVMLVQVVKEERGNKGAALTTYLSLAGRYCVLMPNTARGGGISRKITDARDRRRLKAIASELSVPPGMGLIIRTAGAQRTRAEIKRDFNYLLRLWENIRELTLKSTAPTLVYEEGNLIKRAIRDLYAKDIAEILVEGEEAWKEARAFMKMLMPSHVRNVKLYKEDIPLFAKYNVDAQLDGLFSPVAPLPSGGYLVINQTEALVSIDINSGKSTREHSIEDTALKTNLEAAEEIARQLRLRDLAGLIVIDFIDMEDRRNNRQVERKLKEALKGDRARIQVGRISQFGLLEMSRQRLRQGMLENTTRPCPHCFGTGIIRSVSSAALSVLRGIEEHMAQRKSDKEKTFTLRCHPDSAFYILNEKRDHLTGLEHHYGISIYVDPDRDIAPAAFEIASVRRDWTAPTRARGAVRLETALQEAEEAETPTEREAATTTGEEQPRKKRRRRRGKRGGRKARKRAQARLESLQKDAVAGGADPAASPFKVVDMGDMVIIVRNRDYKPASLLKAESQTASPEAGAETSAETEASATGSENGNGKKRRNGRKRGGARRANNRQGNGRRAKQQAQKAEENAPAAEASGEDAASDIDNAEAPAEVGTLAVTEAESASGKTPPAAEPAQTPETVTAEPEVTRTGTSAAGRPSAQQDNGDATASEPGTGEPSEVSGTPASEQPVMTARAAGKDNA